MKTSILMKKILSLSLASACVVGTPVVAEHTEEIREGIRNEIDNLKAQPTILMVEEAGAVDRDNGEGLSIVARDMEITTADYGSYYSSVDQGYVTSVKNQSPWGACWTFSAISCMESYALANGYAVNVNGADGIDLSEYALAEMSYNDSSVESTSGDTTSINGGASFADCLRSGGNYSIAFKTLNKWGGVYNESDAPYDLNSDDGATWYDLSGKQKAYLLTGLQITAMTNMDTVKAAIVTNGAVNATYNCDTTYMRDGGGYTDYYIYNYATTSSNHAITIVGWDDTISASNFTINGYTPSRDGAWLVKNSWGTSFGKGGYQWISYCDLALNAATAAVYEIVPASTYDYNYQYDGATQMSGATVLSNMFASVFTVGNTNSQELAAVAFGIHSSNVSYSVQVYKLSSATQKPTDGTAVGTAATGSVGMEGYYTVNLPQRISLNAGETFAVVITFNTNVSIWCSTGSWPVGSYATTTCTRADYQNYYGYNNKLYNYPANAYSSNICLKAFAVDTANSGSRSYNTGITSSTYRVDGSAKLIAAIPAGTTVDTARAGLSGCSEIRSGSGAASGSEAAKTGMTAVVTHNGSAVNSYTLVVTGDVNGDGAISIADLMLVDAVILGKTSVGAAAYKACDVTGDGTVDSADYDRLKAALLGETL